MTFFASGSLDRLFRPSSVAVVGASADPARIGGRPIDFMLRAGFTGAIHPVNPKYPVVQGIPCHRSVDELPEDIDVAIVAVTAELVPATIRALGARRTAFAVVFSSGFAEVGGRGAELQAELLAAARQSGVRVLGPNTNGWTSSASQVVGSFGSAWLRDGALPLVDGSVSFITQSGAFGSFIYAMAHDLGLAFRQFAAVGNECDVTFSELLGYAVEDPRVAAVGGYLEGVRDGERFVEVARRAHDLGKPIVLLKVGRTDRAREAAASHTAALVGDDAVYDSVFADTNVIRVDEVQSLLDILYLADRGLVLDDPRVAVLSISGGTGVWAADQLETLGLRLATFDNGTRRRLDALLPAYGSSLNPVDATAQLVNDPQMLHTALEVILADPNVDLCYLAMGLQEETGPAYAQEIVEVAKASATPVLVSWVCGPQRLHRILDGGGVPVFADFFRPLSALARLNRWQAGRRGAATDQQGTGDEPAGMPPQRRSALAEDEAKRRLSALGVPGVPRSAVLSDDGSVRAALADLGSPLVMKVAAPDRVLHKTDLGLVETGVVDAGSGAAALTRLRTSASASVGPGHHVFAEQQAAPGVELIVSLVWDTVFGWQLVVGLGGELVELVDESTMLPAPASSDGVRAALRRLPRARALLAGARGRPACDVDALVRLLVGVGRIPSGPAGADLHQLELNPVRVHVDGVSVLDAVWTLTTPPPDTGHQVERRGTP